MNTFQAGSLFPSISGASLFIGGMEIFGKMESDFIKRKIISYLEKRDKVNISVLSEELDISPRKIVSALKELEKDGLIREA